MTERMSVEAFKAAGLVVARSGRAVAVGERGARNVTNSADHKEAPQRPWLVLLRRPHLAHDMLRRLKPEQELAIEVADALRAWTATGALHATWTAVTPELPARGRFVQAWQALRAAMGAVPGACDYVVTWEHGAGWIEIKRARAAKDMLGHRVAAGQLSGDQRLFRAWVEATTRRHAVCRTVGEVEITLRGWGRLR